MSIENKLYEETFESLVKKIQTKFKEISKTGKLYRSSITGNQIWEIYIESLSGNIFRDPNSSEYNCNHCKNFIKRYGNIVGIDSSNKIVTMFDIATEGEYFLAIKNITAFLKESKISNVFFETYLELDKLNYEKCNRSNDLFRLGIAKNHKKYTQEEVEKYGVVNSSDAYTFNHFNIDIPSAFVNETGKSVETIIGHYRGSKNVFHRAMEEILLETLNLVKELIKQGSLLDGQTHLYKIEQIIPLKIQYDNLPQDQKDNWCWANSYNFSFAKFKNELIGTLCSELSEGEELNKACQSWNKRVDPANYMKVTAPITQKQIEEAKKFVEDNGYTKSFDRRFAIIDDIKVSEILHSNVGKGEIKKVSIFDGVKSTATRHKRNEFEGVEEVSIEKFMTNILPTCTSVEAYFENRLEDNLVSLTTANIPDSKPIFKWSNNYSWTFNGNLAGKSQIKEAVKTAGGKVDGVLRFSIMWADGDGDNSDLDAYCIEPDYNKIFFGNKKSSNTFGNLDVDIQQPYGKLAVENITYPTLGKMANGTYKLFISQYSNRGSKGFKAEIEFDGELYCYTYDKQVLGNIQIAEVTLKDGQFTIVHSLPATDGVGVTKEIYGLETNQFHKVNLICLTPNHWGENNTGNKHYLFMLENCKSPTSIRSFHNENLLPELAEHRRVLEVLASINMIESTPKQLSGLGFNATVPNKLIIKLQTLTTKKIIKIKF
jgi:hypothetical protein